MFSPEEIARYEAAREQRRQALRDAGANEKQIARIMGDDDYRPRSLCEERVYREGDEFDAVKLLDRLRRVEAEEEAEERAEHRRRLVKAGVPLLHLEYVYDVEPDDTDAMKAAREFVQTDMGILVLAGGVGCGKTAGGVWALAQNRRREPGRFVEAHDLPALAGFGEEEQKRFRELVNADMLVIDDLGAEYIDAKGYWLSAFGSLVNKRYADRGKLLITTNLDLNAFKAMYGERVVDRIREVGKFITIGGKSLRVKGEFKATATIEGPPQRPQGKTWQGKPIGVAEIERPAKSGEIKL